MTSTRMGNSAAASSPRSGLLAWLLDRLLPAVEAGRIRIVLPDGDAIERRGKAAGHAAEMTFVRRRGLRRMLLDGEKGFADGFMDGDWTTSDLPSLLGFFLDNATVFKRRSHSTRLTRSRQRLVHWLRANTLQGSRRNIAAHYDLGNRFYAQWLDAGMSYSSALYRGTETLEEAQEAKLDRVIELLDAGPFDRVLEIGCGWGALAERLTRSGVSLTGITLSVEQLRYAEARLTALNLADRADLRLQDYREVDGQYDRIASIEMLEAVGKRYWPVYFRTLRDRLAPRGIAVLQVITIREDRYDAYRSRPDFIQRHIFPGGMLPTVSRVESEAAKAGLTLCHRQSFGDSYARTLQEWRHRFLRSWNSIEPLGFDLRFQRMWDYYLAYCEAGFAHDAIDVSLFRFRG